MTTRPLIGIIPVSGALWIAFRRRALCLPARLPATRGYSRFSMALAASAPWLFCSLVRSLMVFSCSVGVSRLLPPGQDQANEDRSSPRSPKGPAE